LLTEHCEKYCHFLRREKLFIFIVFGKRRRRHFISFYITEMSMLLAIFKNTRIRYAMDIRSHVDRKATSPQNEDNEDVEDEEDNND